MPQDIVVPRHIAVIMDGNNRWAKRQGLAVHAGHRAGVEAVRTILRACNKQGVEILTLFAFSSENWGRPMTEVRALIALFSRYLRSETRQMHADGIRIRFIGQRSRFSQRLQRLMLQTEELTANNLASTLVIAVDYGGHWDVAQAARTLALKVQAGELRAEDINVDMLDAHVAIADLPRPDLCIRTGGDHRLSNFMLWQFAYSELYFTDTLWPDFGELDLARAIQDYSRRERRFGLRDGAAGTGESEHA